MPFVTGLQRRGQREMAKWGFKVCPLCLEEKRRSTEFSRNKRHKGNADCYCKACKKIMDRIWNKEWYERNREYKIRKVIERRQRLKEEARLAKLAAQNPPPPPPPKKKTVVEIARETVKGKKDEVSISDGRGES